jgi:hypothetical protein
VGADAGKEDTMSRAWNTGVCLFICFLMIRLTATQLKGMELEERNILEVKAEVLRVASLLRHAKFDGRPVDTNLEAMASCTFARRTRQII